MWTYDNTAMLSEHGDVCVRVHHSARNGRRLARMYLVYKSLCAIVHSDGIISEFERQTFSHTFWIFSLGWYYRVSGRGACFSNGVIAQSITVGRSGRAQLGFLCSSHLVCSIGVHICGRCQLFGTELTLTDVIVSYHNIPVSLASGPAL